MTYPPDVNETDSYYSLSSLCLIIRTAIQVHTYNNYWVKAEIASLNINSGHAYFELIEYDKHNSPIAKIRATCWKSQFSYIAKAFEQDTEQTLKPGLEVLLYVTIQFHNVYGLSLNIIDIDTSFTIGKLIKQKHAIIERLKTDGVWDMQHEKTLPVPCLRLGVISSEKAAGFQDFEIHIKETKIPFTIKLFPAFVQGVNAEQSIINALKKIQKEKNRWDAVIITRGGGDITDMACFDTYKLCKYVASFPLPVTTGIGHTKDVSILDQIAFISLKTPTALADFFITEFQQNVNHLLNLEKKLTHITKNQITEQTNYLLYYHRSYI